MNEPLDATQLRPAHADEACLLTALAMRSKAHWGYPSEFMQACRKELTVLASAIINPTYYYIAAEYQHRIIGFYALEPLSTIEYELTALFIEPIYIGKGIGRKLLQHAKSTTARCGARYLHVQADPHSVGFYHTAGAELTGYRASASIPGRDLPLLTFAIQY